MPKKKPPRLGRREELPDSDGVTGINLVGIFDAIQGNESVDSCAKSLCESPEGVTPLNSVIIGFAVITSAVVIVSAGLGLVLVAITVVVVTTGLRCGRLTRGCRIGVAVVAVVTVIIVVVRIVAVAVVIAVEHPVVVVTERLLFLLASGGNQAIVVSNLLVVDVLPTECNVFAVIGKQEVIGDGLTSLGVVLTDFDDAIRGFTMTADDGRALCGNFSNSLRNIIVVVC